MVLTRLEATNVRNLKSLGLDPGARLNIFVGDNGSGKTSVLEAAYLLGRGRSFRAGRLDRVISHGSNDLTVFGRLRDQAGGSMALGFGYAQHRSTARVDGHVVANHLGLVQHLPLLLLTVDSHKILSEGPQHRRRFLDWGVFHVEHRFLDQWRRYFRAMRHRNAALRAQGRFGPPEAWEDELFQAAAEVTALRLAYVGAFVAAFEPIRERLLPGLDVVMAYQPGWPEGVSFREVVWEKRDSDQRLGYTQVGPHRADLAVRVRQGRLARDCLSAGQQKLLIAAMFLAHAGAYAMGRGGGCLLMIDDLTAELDLKHRLTLLDLLAELDLQSFVTMTELGNLGTSAVEQVFHVKHGNVTSD